MVQCAVCGVSVCSLRARSLTVTPSVFTISHDGSDFDSPCTMASKCEVEWVGEADLRSAWRCPHGHAARRAARAQA